MTAEIGRFRQLVEDLLEISRYDAGAVRLDRDEIRLAEFVLQAVGASGHHDVPIELDAELAGVVVQADKRRLARVSANLLDNAAKTLAGHAVAAPGRRQRADRRRGPDRAYRSTPRAHLRPLRPRHVAGRRGASKASASDSRSSPSTCVPQRSGMGRDRDDGREAPASYRAPCGDEEARRSRHRARHRRALLLVLRAPRQPTRLIG